ncbi:MAG: hypothetical protein ACRDEB_01315 [Chitinophagaceae bacterium]
MPIKKNDAAGSVMEKRDSLKPVWKKPPSSFSDTLTVHFPSAVFFNSDSLQWKKVKAIMEKNEYETEVHNCFYLMRNARNVIMQYWPTIRIVETTSFRYLLFVKADKSQKIIDLNTMGDICGIYLFDGKKNPELSDMMNIDTALEFYFKHE